MSDYEKCLKSICEFDAVLPGPCSYDGDIFPCTWIAQDTGISLYKVRKIMKQLETDGYVKKGYAGGYNDWKECIFCIHGYYITKKGLETDYWKIKRMQEEEDMRKLAEGD